MRRLLIAFALTSFAATSALAGPLTLGARVGSSIPNLRDNSGGADISSGWSSRVAPYFGLSADVGVTPRWSVQAEVDYASQGGKKNGMQPVTDATVRSMFPDGTPYANFKNEARLDYIEIPVLACFHVGGPNGLKLLAGPYTGILVSAKNITSGTSALSVKNGGQVMEVPYSPVVSFDATTNAKNDLHAFNWGIQFGAGTERRVGAGQVTLDVRAGLGLANIQKDTVNNGKNATGNLVIALGYSRSLSHRD